MDIFSTKESIEIKLQWDNFLLIDKTLAIFDKKINMITNYRLKVEGRVQGVWFRKYTKEKAITLGLKGFVKNDPDGSVLIEAEGSADQLNQFKNWLQTGSPLSEVKHVSLEKGELKSYKIFEIRY